MTKKKNTAVANSSIARERLEGRLIGGRFSDLANYSELFDRSSEAIFLIDVRNFEILEANPAANGLAGAGRLLVGGFLSTFFGDDSEFRLQEWLETHGVETETSLPVEIKSSQEKIIEFSCAKVRLADYCEVFQVIARDVTEERRKAVLWEKQSLTDEMTGLSNFRSFTSRHALEHERALKKNQPYSILFFDVDHFKHFNDRNGHPAGDEALRRVAKVLRECATRTEFVARYGGEEFVVLCSNAGESAAFKFAELARQAIEAEVFPHGEAQPLGRVTVSIGVATLHGNTTPAEILKQADAALYQSKKSGRNRVTSFEESADPVKLKA